MREIMKNLELELDGETKYFRITKMDAFSGAYLMKIVTEKAMPLLQEAIKMTDGGDDEEHDAKLEMKLMTDILPRLLASMDMKELKHLMTVCLQTVDLSFPAGYQNVVDARGNFGVAELQYNTAMCLRLMYEVIVYNCSGFFEESGLASILGNLNGSLQKQ